MTNMVFPGARNLKSMPLPSVGEIQLSGGKLRVNPWRDYMLFIVSMRRLATQMTPVEL